MSLLSIAIETHKLIVKLICLLVSNFLVALLARVVMGGVFPHSNRFLMATEVRTKAVYEAPHSLEYDFRRSTEENYKSSSPLFVGKYKEQRKTLDYSYHSYYTADRQLLHDELIERFHATRVHDAKKNAFCEAPLENWIVFTAGPMGAGKSHTINWLQSHDLFPLDAFVRVDPDQIRELLPEVQGYNAVDASQTGFMTQREVGYISEVLTAIALEKGKNAIVDSSMRDAEWFEKYFESLHAKFPSLKIAILSIEAQRESIFARALKRAKVTGRVVPEQVIIDALERVPRTVESLRPYVDFFAEVRNEDGVEPFVIECEYNRRRVECHKEDGVFWRMKRLNPSEEAPGPDVCPPTSEDGHLYRQVWLTRRHHTESKEIAEEREEIVWKPTWKDDFASIWIMECPMLPPSETASPSGTNGRSRTVSLNIGK